MARLAIIHVHAACVAIIAAVSALDFVTGTEIRTYPLYFTALALAGWRLSRRQAVFYAALATVGWSSSNVLLPVTATPGYVLAINTVTQLAAFVLVGTLIAEVRTRLDRERAASRTDLLTKLPNRRGFLERADVLVAAGARASRPMTLAYLDLDHFKRLNDERGHAAGDEALQEIGELLRAATRIGDVVGRLGGDEFGVLLSDATAEVATGILDRVRTTVADRMTARDWPITASIGAVSFDSGVSLDAALAAADRAMYAVKERGRNQVHIEALPRRQRAAG